jgi:hypothetical protein
MDVARAHGDKDVAYARADKIKQPRGYPLGQDIWGGLFLGYFFLATQKEVARHQAKHDAKIFT